MIKKYIFLIRKFLPTLRCGSVTGHSLCSVFTAYIFAIVSAKRKSTIRIGYPIKLFPIADCCAVTGNCLRTIFAAYVFAHTLQCHFTGTCIYYKKLFPCLRSGTVTVHCLSTVFRHLQKDCCCLLLKWFDPQALCCLPYYKHVHNLHTWMWAKLHR